MSLDGVRQVWLLTVAAGVAVGGAYRHSSTSLATSRAPPSGQPSSTSSPPPCKEMLLHWVLAPPFVARVTVTTAIVAASAVASTTAHAAVATDSTHHASGMLAPRLFDNSVVADELNAMLQQTRNHGEALDATFLALCGILVFLMQTGFAMLTAGYVGGTCAQIAGRVSLSVCGRERVVRPEIWVSSFR